MSTVRICDACKKRIAMTDSAVVMHVQDNDFDFHDTPNCWQRVRQAIFDAIAAAQASP